MRRGYASRGIVFKLTDAAGKTAPFERPVLIGRGGRMPQSCRRRFTGCSWAPFCPDSERKLECCVILGSPGGVAQEFLMMCRVGCWLTAILLLAIGALAWPQSRRPVPIEPLLRNADPRLVAMGAWEVIRRQDDSETQLLIDLAERWDPERWNTQEKGDWFDAMTVVLDALIQRRVMVSPAAVLAVAPAFPDQALILAARMSPRDAEPILLSWYQAGRGVHRAGVDGENPTRVLLGRIAAMFLARDDPD